MGEAIPESGRRGKIGSKTRLSERRGWADHKYRSVLLLSAPNGERPASPRWVHPFAYAITDETYALLPVSITRREAFSFGLARKLLAHYEGTPLHLDMRSVLDKIAESLAGDITIEPAWLSEHVGVLPEDRVRIDPEVWVRLAVFVERREAIRATCQTFDGRVSEYALHPYHLLAYHGN